MTAKSFLLQECENIKAVLEETLRFKYGISGSKDFYDECNTRLAFITSEINATDEGDKIALATNLGLLLELSKLISRIERSSLGQYSWPFVDELKKIAFAICAEETLDDPETPPMVHVLSEGGLDSYAIFPEQQRPSAGKRRILTIVFPRTLKHFVLLHSILGHEIGHAMWRSSKHQAELRQALHDAFVVSNGKFSSQQATTAWIYDQNAPAEIRTQLTNLAAHGLQQQFFFQWANWEAWKEEILCDLIGILTFGPSFIAAECNLLYSLDLTGVGIGTAHPPVGCRVNLFLMASRILGYREIQFPDHDLQAAYDRFWGELETYAKQDPWFNIFTENEIRTALDRIGTILGAHPPAAYMAPSLDLLADLFRQLQSAVPPIGFKLDEGKNPSAYSVDFRHILYAGWLASKGNQDIKFPDLNRLCEHAIMQQRAIDIFNCQQG